MTARRSLLLALLLLSPLSAAQSPALRECSFDPDIPLSPLPTITSERQELSELERFVFDAFVRSYGSKVGEFRLQSIEGEANARVGAFGIALNRKWMNLIGEPMAAAVLAHELGHVVQAFQLMPLHPDAKAYGPEGEVDFYAGRLLAASGMTEDMFEGAVCPVISRYPETKTHLPGHIRVMLMRGGFYLDK